MGCLNENAAHGWHTFGNIHLSGPCSRRCYFCIGQHMMALDPLNNLDEWPLKNIDQFVDKCVEMGVSEINVTGTNTDPLLYEHTPELKRYLVERIPNLRFGIRTNGVGVGMFSCLNDIWWLYDKGSVTFCSADPVVYRQMMGCGTPPNLDAIVAASKHMNGALKANVVLGPENTGVNAIDLVRTIDYITSVGITRINLREPYGQPHIGDPLAAISSLPEVDETYGMPTYEWRHHNNVCRVTYWDVHYCEVESVNLYANGIVSTTYPISKGHDPVNGKVLDQSHFPGGRIHEQWVQLQSV